MRAFTADLPIRSLKKFFAFRAVRFFFFVLIVLGLIAAIWFGLDLTGWPVVSTWWFRALLIGLFVSGLALFYGLRWRRRRRAAEDLEESLMPQRVGDGEVLAERMDAALATLKKAGGKTYLYDLPWYIIIGPPGVGKTTALRYSGIEFPGQDQLPDHGQGFGGTRNCDWWFAEDAVLIDTAGRYTSQDSDAEADKASWSSFLELLKKGRPDQPVNGVILAFSVDEMMRGSQEDLAHHAQTVRARLGEIHETLRIDFPVYVVFTKADLISGFREYFASFSQSRRNGVWGVTFQTRDRKEPTHEQAGAEFDALVSRLSDEVVDRMSEEPDAVSRIAIFGLPGQMAMLRENVSEFLRLVFEPTRFKTNAILRGFYFTSGTQEGTPIDQVLGNMDQRDAGGFQPEFMSGKGKSYFLRDLLKEVIFAERDWVNYDVNAVRRMSILRGLAMGIIAVVTLGLMSAFSYSAWRNLSLVKGAEASAVAYQEQAQPDLSAALITDPNPLPVLNHLDALSRVPGAPNNELEREIWDGFGLSQYSDVSVTARQAYADGLERLLRPRMMLQLQQDIPQHLADGDFERAYQALKVYLHLGGEGQGDGDEVIINHFNRVWRELLPGAGRLDQRQNLESHVRFMLEEDGDRPVRLRPEPTIVETARNELANLSLEDQAWATILSGVPEAGLADFNLVDRVSGNVRTVFQTVEGTDLDALSVPGLYTYQGYWGYFVNEVASAGERLADERWVLAEVGERADYNAQLANLENALVRRYRIAFKAAWDAMFEELDLAPLSADAPAYEVLGFAASEFNSPLLELVQAVTEETRMVRLYEDLAAMGADDAAQIIAAGQGGGSLAGNLGDAGFQRLYARSGVFQKVVLDFLQDNAGGKITERAGSGSALSADLDRQRAEGITGDFAAWHGMLRGDLGERDIDRLITALETIRNNRLEASFASSTSTDPLLTRALDSLTRNNRSRPPTIARLMNAAESEFRAAEDDATLTELEQQFTENVMLFCRDNIAPYYPFRDTRTHVPPSTFGQFFGYGGLMDTFFSQHLQPHVMRTTNGLVADPQSRIGPRLSRNTLRQFERALAIQQAFFPLNSTEPRVSMSVKLASSQPPVSLSMLTLHGKPLQLLPNSPAQEFVWPGGARGIEIRLILATAQATEPRFELSQGRWDIARFLARGRARGNGITVTQNVQGASVAYRFEFEKPEIPFLMPELGSFRCPTSLAER